MSRESVCRCPPSCPIVRAQLRDAIEQAPYLVDEFFPREKNDVLRPLDDIARNDKLKPVIAAAYEKLVRPEEIVTYEPPKAVEDTIEAKPIQPDIQKRIVREPPSIQEPTVIPAEKIIDRDEKRIDLVERELIKEPTIIPEPIVIPPDKILDDKKLDLVEEKLKIPESPIIAEPTIIPEEKKIDRDDKEIDLIKEKELVKEIIPKPIPVIPPDTILDRDEKKVDLFEELIEEPTIIPEPTVIPADKILDDDEKKIDLIEEKELVEEPKKLPIIAPSEKRAIYENSDAIKEKKINGNKTVAIPPHKVPVAIEELEIIKNEISREAEEIKLEAPRELKELKPEPVKDSQPEERLSTPTDYEKFIAEEYREVLLRKKSPELQLPKREEVTTVSDKRAVREVNARRAERIVSPAEDACDETCPLIQEQKERIARKLEERQRIVDHYYLTKGISYFEEVCTCSLACVIYNLSRDPFVKSIFASLALFAVGLKLCSELDAWEMPSRISK